MSEASVIHRQARTAHQRIVADGMSGGHTFVKGVRLYKDPGTFCPDPRLAICVQPHTPLKPVGGSRILSLGGTDSIGRLCDLLDMMSGVGNEAEGASPGEERSPSVVISAGDLTERDISMECARGCNSSVDLACLTRHR